MPAEAHEGCNLLYPLHTCMNTPGPRSPHTVAKVGLFPQPLRSVRHISGSSISSPALHLQAGSDWLRGGRAQHGVTIVPREAASPQARDPGCAEVGGQQLLGTFHTPRQYVHPPNSPSPTHTLMRPIHLPTQFPTLTHSGSYTARRGRTCLASRPTTSSRQQR